MFKIIFAIILVSLTTYAEQTNPTTVFWTEEDGCKKQVTQADINEAKKPILGYVFDLRSKPDLCYTGVDVQAIRILTTGLKRRGNELCDGNLTVKDGTITLGPCWMPEIHDEPYYLELPVCK